MPGRLLRLAGIATAAGAFSGLFGVGMAGGVLELSFAAVQLAFAWQLAKTAGLR